MTSLHDLEIRKAAHVQTILFLDLETTGLDLETTHIVEYAALEYLCSENPLKLLEPAAFSVGLVNPGIPIPPEASAVHHLVDADVANALTEGDLAARLAAEPVFPDVLCGHNIGGYDLPIARKRLNGWPPEAPVLDTDRLARHVWPGLPSYKLEVLAYRYGLHPNLEDAPRLLTPSRSFAHGAAYDVLLCVNLVKRALLDLAFRLDGDQWCAHRTEGWINLQENPAGFGPTPLLALAAFSMEPIQVERMYFGKHSGAQVKDLPRDYVDWLRRQPWFAAEHRDLAWTLKNLQAGRA